MTYPQQLAPSCARVQVSEQFCEETSLFLPEDEKKRPVSTEDIRVAISELRASGKENHEITYKSVASVLGVTAKDIRGVANYLDLAPTPERIRHAVRELKNDGVESPGLIEVAEALGATPHLLSTWMRHKGRLAGESWAKLGVSLDHGGLVSEERHELKKFISEVDSRGDLRLALVFVLELYNKEKLNRTQAALLISALVSGETRKHKLDTPLASALGIRPESVAAELHGPWAGPHARIGVWSLMQGEILRRVKEERDCAGEEDCYLDFMHALLMAKREYYRQFFIIEALKDEKMPKEVGKFILQRIAAAPDTVNPGDNCLTKREREVLLEFIARRESGTTTNHKAVACQLDIHVSVVAYAFHGRNDEPGGIKKITSFLKAAERDSEEIEVNLRRLARGQTLSIEELLELKAAVMEVPHKRSFISLSEQERFILTQFVEHKMAGLPVTYRELAKELKMSPESVYYALAGREGDPGAFVKLNRAPLPEGNSVVDEYVTARAGKGLASLKGVGRDLPKFISVLEAESLERQILTRIAAYVVPEIAHEQDLFVTVPRPEGNLRRRLNGVERRAVIRAYYSGKIGTLSELKQNLPQILGFPGVSVVPEALYRLFHDRTEPGSGRRRGAVEILLAELNGRSALARYLKGGGTEEELLRLEKTLSKDVSTCALTGRFIGCAKHEIAGAVAHALK